MSASKIGFAGTSVAHIDAISTVRRVFRVITRVRRHLLRNSLQIIQQDPLICKCKQPLTEDFRKILSVLEAAQ